MPAPPSQAKICDVYNCWRTTREGKPFCTEHVELHPEIIALKAEIARREREAQLAHNGKRHLLDVNGSLAREILGIIQERGATVERISRSAHLSHDGATSFLRALAEAGLVALSKNRRDSLVARPIRRGYE